MKNIDWEKVIAVGMILIAVLAIVASVLIRMWIVNADLPLWLKLVLWR